jgi:acetamidase/formamidase
VNHDPDTMTTSRPTRHTLHAHQSHHGWNNEFPPLLTIAPGETVEFEIRDASGGQITERSGVEAVSGMDFSLVNPVAGPVAIDGAVPGDALEVTLLSLTPSGWGWTANIPGFGLLADQFPAPALHLWKYRPDLAVPAAFGPGGKVPLRPFTGTIGVAPAEPGLHSIVPPRRVGGNMDIRDVAAGTVLHLPIEVAGALFSVGDTHAAQGDGEVCGTAIESPMTIALKFDLVKGANLAMPRFTTPGPVTRHLDAKGYEVTTGIGPDLMTGAREAVSGMIELLSRRHGMAPVDAYMLCSVCADLRISSIVDLPNWVVSLYFPRVVLD